MEQPKRITYVIYTHDGCYTRVFNIYLYVRKLNVENTTSESYMKENINIFLSIVYFCRHYSIKKLNKRQLIKTFRWESNLEANKRFSRIQCGMSNPLTRLRYICVISVICTIFGRDKHKRAYCRTTHKLETNGFYASRC